ncbi:hypothetical protein L3Y34_017070 [Caenorhabditis briggsae]|uniref:Uncharacterized protein n=1 Tax=Caenorhabditis briggsae TaxID=6238 RepID=A0AAE9DGH4_CAEBR|nr:hypothetical protein L3Y34_017070 [Caenorhabditis briggsae]
MPTPAIENDDSSGDTINSSGAEDTLDADNGALETTSDSNERPRQPKPGPRPPVRVQPVMPPEPEETGYNCCSRKVSTLFFL